MSDLYKREDLDIDWLYHHYQFSRAAIVLAASVPDGSYLAKRTHEAIENLKRIQEELESIKHDLYHGCTCIMKSENIVYHGECPMHKKGFR